MHHLRVFLTFLRNAVIRETTFRANFLIQVVTRAFWFFAQIALYKVIYERVDSINGWTEPQYFAFMATGMLINGIVETFFMPNCENLSEQIRTGRLDMALLKPIDTQFLVSLERLNLAMLSQILLAIVLLVTSLIAIGNPVTLLQTASYLIFVAAGVAFFYSLMITTACTSIWLGRNQSLYDFWFYITVFARYPRSIYDGRDSTAIEGGEVLQFGFSYVLPILFVVTVPAKIILGTLNQLHWALVAAVSAAAGLVIARIVFRFSLESYRSASS